MQAWLPLLQATRFRCSHLNPLRLISMSSRSFLVISSSAFPTTYRSINISLLITLSFPLLHSPPSITDLYQYYMCLPLHPNPLLSTSPMWDTRYLLKLPLTLFPLYRTAGYLAIPHATAPPYATSLLPVSTLQWCEASEYQSLHITPQLPRTIAFLISAAIDDCMSKWVSK